MFGYPSICRSRYLSFAWKWIAIKVYSCCCSIKSDDDTYQDDNLLEEKYVIIELLNEYDD